MDGSGKKYLAGGICLLLFISAQAFQELAYRFWIPASRGPEDDLKIYLLTVDRARALLVGATILLLIVPFVVIALRYFRAAPLASVLGLIFGTAFIGCEVTYRSLEFFVVGMKWAHKFQNATPEVREIILHRFAVWTDVAQGWYFPLLLAYLLASCCFLAATWTERGQGWPFQLAPISFGLSALRLLARLLSMFAGQTWLATFNDQLYFPAVLVVQGLLALWFFHVARFADASPAKSSAPSYSKSAA